MIAAPERLGDDVRNKLGDRHNALYLSAASAWEIAIKHRIGRLPLPAPPEEFVPERLVRDGVTPLPVEHRHALRVASLPALHRDPFDRLLVAQAQIERLVLVTADTQLAEYEIEMICADGRTTSTNRG